MTSDIRIAFVAAVLVPVSAPRPGHLLMLSSSETNGFGRVPFTAGGDLDAAFWPRFAILFANCIAIAGIFLILCGSGAIWLAARLKGPAQAWIDRLGGSFVIIAAPLPNLKSLRPST